MPSRSAVERPRRRRRGPRLLGVMGGEVVAAAIGIEITEVETASRRRPLRRQVHIRHRHRVRGSPPYQSF